MSRAFVKEDAGDGGDELPDRPISPHTNYVTPQGMALIDAELAHLGSALAAAGEDRAAVAHVQRISAIGGHGVPAPRSCFRPPIYPRCGSARR